MDSALATLREEGRFTLSHVLQHRLDQLSERVGQLSAVVACQLEAA
jgi:predicted DNA-binding protein